MLAMGFEEEVSEILGATPEDRRTHLVSATFPPSVRSVAARHQRDSVMVAGTAPGKSNSDISYTTMVVGGNQKLQALVNVLLMEPDAKTLIFVRTRVDTAGLSDALAELGFSVRPLSGDLNQRERTATLNAFRRGQTPILVATDVAARGLDVQDIAQVIHVDLPENADMLTHRSGRTGRAGRKGRSLIFVPPRAARRVDAMLRHAGITAPRTEIPNRDDIHRAADQRLIEKFAELDVSGALQTRTASTRWLPSCSRTAIPWRWWQPSSARPITAAPASPLTSSPWRPRKAGIPGPAAPRAGVPGPPTGPGSR